MRNLDEMLRDAEPFPDSLVEKLPGRGGGPELSYVPWYQYAQRLLLHYPDHDYKITAVTHAGDTWAVAVELVLNDTTYAGIGEGDTPTSAESNAYKRACAHAGIGLHLYGGYWLHGRLQKEAEGAE